MKKNTLLLIAFILSITLYNCYTLTGSSLSPEVKTANINVFPNYSTLFNPDLSQIFTNSLIDRFDQRTKLQLTNEEGDIKIEGEITNYDVSAANVGIGSGGTELASQNKLTITVKVRYYNEIEPSKSWDKSFTDSEPFDANETIESVQDAIVPIINGRIIDQIFNAIVADW